MMASMCAHIYWFGCHPDVVIFHKYDAGFSEGVSGLCGSPNATETCSHVVGEELENMTDFLGMNPVADTLIGFFDQVDPGAQPFSGLCYAV